MNTDRIHEIEDRALDLLIDAFVDEEKFDLPINLTKIASVLGLSLKEGIFKNPDVSGAYVRSLKTIYVAEKDSYQRKSFTIAHELGHFILHSEKKEETFYRKDLIFVDKEKNHLNKKPTALPQAF